MASSRITILNLCGFTSILFGDDERHAYSIGFHLAILIFAETCSGSLDLHIPTWSLLLFHQGRCPASDMDLLKKRTATRTRRDRANFPRDRSIDPRELSSIKIQSSKTPVYWGALCSHIANDEYMRSLNNETVLQGTQKIMVSQVVAIDYHVPECVVYDVVNYHCIYTDDNKECHGPAFEGVIADKTMNKTDHTSLASTDKDFDYQPLCPPFDLMRHYFLLACLWSFFFYATQQPFD